MIKEIEKDQKASHKEADRTIGTQFLNPMSRTSEHEKADLQDIPNPPTLYPVETNGKIYYYELEETAEANPTKPKPGGATGGGATGPGATGVDACCCCAVMDATCAAYC